MLLALRAGCLAQCLRARLSAVSAGPPPNYVGCCCLASTPLAFRAHTCALTRLLCLALVSNIGVPSRDRTFKNVTSPSPTATVGIIGPNGAGKTSIFKLITEELEPTVGSVARKPGLRHALLDQHRAFEGATTVWEAGAAAWREVIALEKLIAEQAIELGELGERVTDVFLERFGQTQERFADLGGYIYHARSTRCSMGWASTA